MILTTEILLSMTPEQQMKSIVKEKYKCYTNFKYLIETYFTVDAGGTRIPFILFPHQEDALNAYINFPNNITMKTRQMGFTTFTAAYVAACMINKNGFKCLIISKEQKSSMDFLKAIKDILSECRKMTQLSGVEDSQSWLVPDFAKGYNNKKDFILENGSLVTAQGNTDNAGRGIPGLHLAIVDEVAFIDNNTPDRMSNIWAALGPALSTVKGKTIMISTPKGSGGWYYDTYTNADAMGFNVIEAHWTKHPLFSQGQYSWIHDATHPDGGYIKFYNKTWPDTLFDKASKSYLKIEKDSYNFIRDGKIRSPWYDFESKKLGPRLTLCELDCSFVGTGGEVFEGDILREFKLHAQASEFVNIAEFFNGFLRDYKEFKAPEEGHKYVIASDVATGDGSDYSTFVILDLNTLEICGTFKGQMLPSVLARMLYTVGKRFGTPPIVVENAGGGGSTLQDLKEMGYPNIYYSTLNKKDESLGVKKRKIGLWVSEEVRKKGGDKLEQYIRDGLLKIPCMWIAEEFFHWIWDKDGKRRHAPGKHDDMIMALQHAIYYHAFVYKRNTRNRENFRTMFDIQRNGYEYDNDMGRGMIASHNTEFNPHVEKRNNGLDIIDQKRSFGETSQEQKQQPRIRFL